MKNRKDLIDKNASKALAPKHYSPATKEWCDSIYMYNAESTKGVKARHEATVRMIKSHVNLYSRNLDLALGYNRTRRYRARTIKTSVNRILTGRLETKHTNDRVVLTIYIYNTIKASYKNIIRRLKTSEEIERLTENSITSSYIRSEMVNEIGVFIHKELAAMYGKYRLTSDYNKALTYMINRLAKGLGLEKANSECLERKCLKLYLLINVIKKYNDLVEEKFKEGLVEEKATEKALRLISEAYIIKLIRVVLKREYTSVYYKSLMSLNKAKFQKHYTISLEDQIKRIYNKAVEFNFVNLKYLYMDSSLLSEALIAKLRKKKTSVYHRLKSALGMFKIPFIDRERYYEEKYTRNFIVQDPELKRLGGESDSIDLSLNRYLPELENSYIDKSEMQKYSYVLHSFLYNLKYKAVKGIRLELSGRITRRYTAARSVHKLRYKGNIRNTTSSDQRLSAIMLRGYTESNVQYSSTTDKRRIGSFGLKTWVSGI